MSDFKRLSRSVKGLTVLVTGAASGMGRATAQVFAADGANVAVTDISAEATQAVASEIAASGGAAKAWTLDVSDRHDINAVVNEVAAHFGGLDIVVNNAGISVRVAIDDEGYDEAWAKGLAVMLTAHQRIIRAVRLRYDGTVIDRKPFDVAGPAADDFSLTALREGFAIGYSLEIGTTFRAFMRTLDRAGSAQRRRAVH